MKAAGIVSIGMAFFWAIILGAAAAADGAPGEDVALVAGIIFVLVLVGCIMLLALNYGGGQR